MLLSRRADWQLPDGISRGLWDYSQAPHIATEYDDYFSYNSLFAFDRALLERHFERPGVLVDLGCGTGRLLVPFARQGYTAIGVDLSTSMLQVVGEKAVAAGVTIHRVLANLVDLGCLADGTADYCICMFSTLGMIQGAAARRRVIQHARRILKPGGRFVLHVHNRWYYLTDPQGRWWIIQNGLASLLGREQAGDKIADYRGIPNMRLHLFTAGELKRLLRREGFRVIEWIPLDATRRRELRWPWIAGSCRANGWIVVCGD